MTWPETQTRRAARDKKKVELAQRYVGQEDELGCFLSSGLPTGILEIYSRARLSGWVGLIVGIKIRVELFSAIRADTVREIGI